MNDNITTNIHNNIENMHKTYLKNTRIQIPVTKSKQINPWVSQKYTLLRVKTLAPSEPQNSWQMDVHPSKIVKNNVLTLTPRSQ